MLRKKPGGAELQEEAVTWLDEARLEGEKVGKKKGKIEGIIETARLFAATDDFIVQRLMERLGCTQSEAENALKAYDAKVGALNETT